MTFSFDKIILSICESTTSWNLKKLDYFLPTIELAFHEMQIFYTRHSNNSKTIIVKAENLLGLFFNYSQNEDEEPRVFIQGFINNLNKRIEQSLKTFIEKKNFLMSLRVNDSQNDFKLQSAHMTFGQGKDASLQHFANKKSIRSAFQVDQLR